MGYTTTTKPNAYTTLVDKSPHSLLRCYGILLIHYSLAPLHPCPSPAPSASLASLPLCLALPCLAFLGPVHVPLCTCRPLGKKGSSSGVVLTQAQQAPPCYREFFTERSACHLSTFKGGWGRHLRCYELAGLHHSRDTVLLVLCPSQSSATSSPTSQLLPQV